MTNEELAVLIQGGERDRLLELWAGVRRFAFRQARRWARRGIGVDDLMQCAFLALLDALEGFNAAAGSFIGWYSVRLKATFTAATGQRTQRDRLDPLHSAASLDTPVGDDEDGGTLAEMIRDPSAERAFEAVAERDRAQRLHAAVAAALEGLPAEQAQALRLHVMAGMTLAQAAAIMGVTVADVRRFEVQGLRALRRPEITRKLLELRG